MMGVNRAKAVYHARSAKRKKRRRNKRVLGVKHRKGESVMDYVRRVQSSAAYKRERDR
jgi:hypothetical protein